MAALPCDSSTLRAFELRPQPLLLSPATLWRRQRRRSPSRHAQAAAALHVHCFCGVTDERALPPAPLLLRKTTGGDQPGVWRAKRVLAAGLGYGVCASDTSMSGPSPVLCLRPPPDASLLLAAAVADYQHLLQQQGACSLLAASRRGRRRRLALCRPSLGAPRNVPPASRQTRPCAPARLVSAGNLPARAHQVRLAAVLPSGGIFSRLRRPPARAAARRHAPLALPRLHTTSCAGRARQQRIRRPGLTWAALFPLPSATTSVQLPYAL